ncbi:T9SS type A sorting domain-containing protein [Chitinophagaceae bacterium MMS25-I14]
MKRIITRLTLCVLLLAAGSAVRAQNIFFEAHNVHVDNTAHTVVFDLYVSGSATYVSSQTANANNGLQNVDVAYDIDLGSTGTTGPLTPTGVSISTVSPILNAATATTSLGGASPAGYDSKFKVNLTRNVSTSSPITNIPTKVATITVTFASTVVIGTNGATLMLRTNTGGTGSKWSDFLGNTGQPIAASNINPTPLPLVISGFDAETDHCAAELNWTTGSEDNAKEIIVETSSDGVNFGQVAVVAAKGSGSAYHYSVAGGAGAYYRIKIIAYDNTWVQSAVIRTAAGDCGHGSVTISPNPADKELAVRINVPADVKDAAISITDVSGRVVYRISNDLNKGDNIVLIDMNKYAPGIYYVHVLAGSGMDEVTKLLKNN